MIVVVKVLYDQINRVSVNSINVIFEKLLYFNLKKYVRRIDKDFFFVNH